MATKMYDIGLGPTIYLKMINYIGTLELFVLSKAMVCYAFTANF